MAKLRITDAAGALDVDAYVSVFDNLIAPPARPKLNAYLAAQPDQRPALLQEAAGGPGSQKITQEPHAGGNEAIANSNCEIFSQADVKKGAPGAGARSKATVPIPDQSVANLLYLEKYAQVIHDLFDTDRVKCCKFLFAVGMMTRCR